MSTEIISSLFKSYSQCLKQPPDSDAMLHAKDEVAACSHCPLYTTLTYFLLAPLQLAPSTMQAIHHLERMGACSLHD